MNAPTGMNESSEHGMEGTSTDAVNELLQPLCTLSSWDGQLDFLRLLRKRLADPSDALAESIRRDPLTRQELARAILQRVVHARPSSSSQHVVQSILVDCCGASCVLEAALRLFRDDNSVDDITSRSFLGVESSLSVVAWIFVRQPDVLYQLLLEVSTDSSGPTSSFTGCRVSDAIEVLSSVNTSFLQTWTHQVVLLSRVIANRCNRPGGHFRLPNWAVASNWEARLVECALTATCNHGSESSLPSHYLKCLLTCLLSRVGGGSESAALGIYRTWIKLNEAKEGVPSSASGTRPSQEAVNILQNFPHTQVAHFCRVMLLLALARNPGGVSPSTERVTEDVTLPGWLLDFCLPLLATSDMVQDRFVQETLLSHSPVLPPVVSGVATMLHMISEEPVPSGFSAPDEGDDSRTSDDEESCSEVELPSHASASTSGPLLRQIHRTAPLWSSSQLQSRPSHVQPCQRHQRLLTVFLRKSFELLSCSESSDIIHRKIIVLDASNDTVLLLMQGVSDRLQSSNPDIRKDGMIIGEVLGKHVLNQSIIFDELHSEVKNDVGVTSAHVKNQSGVPPSVARKDRVRRSEGRIRNLQIDPDALYVSDSDSSEDESNRSVESHGQYSDDSEGDDDEGAYMRENYNIEDDELDLRVASVPLYLQECLDLLRTPETDEVAHSKHQAALETLPKLIRARPGDLLDFGPVLAKQLVGMENNFSIEGFDDKLLEPLCALVVEEPLMVGQALVDDLFHRDGSLYNRMLTLTALEEASLELSGAKSLGRSANPEYVIFLPFTFNSMDSSLTLGSRLLVGARSFGKRHLVSPDQRTSVDAGSSVLELNTRRWGRLRTGNATVDFKNRFSDIAPLWFYSLVENFWERKEKASLWSGHVGSLLLARFIETLTVLVENCGPFHSSTQVLANDLLELAWIFRDAEVAEVRSSVLCAVGTSLTMMSEKSLSRLLFDTHAMDLPHYIESTSRSDRDHNCRSLAMQISSSISKSVESLGW